MSSLWELESFYAPQDVIIAGGGFAGLWSAYYLKKLYPDYKILIIEKDVFPSGASTRNAGFACFGSVTELINDALISGKEKMLESVAMRYEGLKKIRKVFSAGEINYEQHGGYELISQQQYSSKKQLQHDINWLNDALQKTTGHKNIFKLTDKKIRRFNFQQTDHLIENKLEGQLHPGKMMQALIQKLHAKGIRILPGIELKAYEERNGKVLLHTNAPVSLTASRLLICNNGFDNHLLPKTDITPARGQVLITSPVKDLQLKGTFHYDEGYYYFRNLGNRVLLGGARNKAFEEEHTTTLSTSSIIQNELEQFLKEVVIPGKAYTIEHRWSGIMGLATDKFPTVEETTPNCFCVVGLGGIGVALAPVTGKQVAKMMVKKLL